MSEFRQKFHKLILPHSGEYGDDEYEHGQSHLIFAFLLFRSFLVLMFPIITPYYSSLSSCLSRHLFLPLFETNAKKIILQKNTSISTSYEEGRKIMLISLFSFSTLLQLFPHLTSLHVLLLLWLVI